PSRAVARRSHSKQGVGVFVETCVRVEARLVDRLGHGSCAYELAARPFGTMRRRIRFRRDSGRRLEETMRMRRAHRHVARELLERGRGIARFDETTKRGDGGGVALRSGWLRRSAALAGPEAGSFRVVGGLMERDIARARRAGAARRTAVHAGRANGI